MLTHTISLNQSETSYREKIRDLIKKHDMQFMNEFGGYRLKHKTAGECSINMIGNYKNDYKLLLDWLKEKELE